MSLSIIPVNVEDIRRELEGSANMVAFVNTSLVAICERDQSASLDSSALSGMQQIMFIIEDKMRGIENCFDKNPHLLKPNLTEKPLASKKAV